MNVREPKNILLNNQVFSGELPDGKYLTCPNWGYTKRVVSVVDGKVSVIEGSYKFHQLDFFSVNYIISSL